MMTGFGQFGPIEMGGMFSLMKVREGLARDDYKDPGPYKNPPGTVAYQLKGPVPEAPSRKGAAVPRQDEIEVNVVKPRTNGHSGHH
jgi:hypothetical protein